MSFILIIGLLYAIYSVYTLYVACVSNYPIPYVIGGLIVVWGIYLSFFLGFRSVKKKRRMLQIQDQSQFLFSKIADWSPKQYLLAMIVGWVCSVLATRFYTGKGIMQVISGLGSDASVYYQYQNYFIESNIASFSPVKILYILMMVYSTVMLLWSLVGIFLLKKDKTRIHYVFCISNIFSYLYFGLARGTNFELFLIFIVIVYIMLRRGYEKRGKKNGESWKKLVLLGGLGLGFVMAFRSVVMARGIEFDTYISSELTFNADSYLARFFPMLTNIVLSVFNYLGFGMYTIGATIAEIRLGSIQDLLASLIPFGYTLIRGNTFDFYMHELIDIGVRWVPDFNMFTNLLGLPLFYALVGVWGRFLAKLRVKSPLLKELVYCLTFIELLSLPVGNFLFASSFNTLTSLIILFYVLVEKAKLRVT